MIRTSKKIITVVALLGTIGALFAVSKVSAEVRSITWGQLKLKYLAGDGSDVGGTAPPPINTNAPATNTNTPPPPPPK